MTVLGNHAPAPVRLHIHTLVFCYDELQTGSHRLPESSTTQIPFIDINSHILF